MDSRSYWNSNLDPDNLSRPGGFRYADLEEALAFAATPEFLWLKEHAGDMRGKCLVDLGGGIGMHAILWARWGARVVMVDIAANRLAALRATLERAGLAERVWLVAGAAEALPLGAEQADFVFTKSVLIHTRLPEAAREIARALKPGGRGLFIEPLNRNPIIRFYRRFFAPKVWRSITRYFDEESLSTLREGIGALRWEPFYLLSAGSFFWQYGRKNLARFQSSLRRWGRLDGRLLAKRPGLGRWCWFAAIEARKAR